MKISSRQDLARVLRSIDASERQLVFESLDQAFDEALEHGKQINQEAVEELYLCYCENGMDLNWYVYLLLRLRNKYSIEVARKEFLSTRNNKILLLAATHIARLPETERIAFLAPLVMDASNAARCRAAANILDDCFDRLAPGVALRAAIISDHELPLPPLNAGTLDIWLSELQGPYPNSAKEALLHSGNEALECLLTAWHQLPLAVCPWVLRTACERNLAGVEQRLKEVLRDGQYRELTVVALECIKTRKLDDEDLVASLCDHRDPVIRAAAIAAGNARLNWTDRFAAEESEDVRLAILDQIGRSGDFCDMGVLIDCLQDRSWRIRARATDVLVALAPASLEPLRAALGHEDERVKVAAAKGLYRLGKQDWITAELQLAEEV